MDHIAPVPSSKPSKVGGVTVQQEPDMSEINHSSAVTVTIAGCGGAGVNRARFFKTANKPVQVLFFDTSLTNTRYGESANIVGNGSGSGSHRAENAKDIERTVTQFSKEEMGLGDVAIVMFSLGGGSGSVIGPLMVREYAKRGSRVIAVIISDNSYSVSSDNGLKTLKTLTSICANNDIYLPCVFLSNDAGTRKTVDDTSDMLVTDLVDLLTTHVYEVDRNDRLNWIDPTKVVKSAAGLKLMTFISDKKLPNPKVVLGMESKDMVDSMLILENVDQDESKDKLLPARLKKTGFYTNEHRRIVGMVSSDISAIDEIIDKVEHVEHADKAQKHQTIGRLNNAAGSDDLIL